MGKIQDFRSDFRKGRTGSSLRIRQDANAYFSSVRDANNMMVLSDGRIQRRWGTFVKQPLTADARLEVWDFAEADNLQFLLIFEAGILRIMDMTGAIVKVFSYMPWTEDTKKYVSITYDRDKIIITDESFQPIFITIKTDPTIDFVQTNFEFDVTDDKTRIKAPFFQFADPQMSADLTIFTSAGLSSGYGTYLQTVLGGSGFDLGAGTGSVTMDQDFFTAEHVGSRLRILDGEVEITAVTNARTADVTVRQDVATRLEPNPFYLRKGSKLVEVTKFEHGFAVGDRVFFAGIAEADALPALMNNAVVHATSGTAAAAPAGGAAAYTIKRIISKDAFEIECAGTPVDNDILTGGPDVLLIPLDGVKNIKEPAFSNARGWPTACTVHERRLWLGGTKSLPDAAWASQFSEFENFDTGDGDTTDAIALYGIGKQARIRHLVSSFDMLIFTDNQELYIPGSTVQVMEQSTIRVVSSTEIGCSYTRPYKFDGGVFYVDKIGTTIREFSSANRDSEYTSLPASIVASDWVKYPKDACAFVGSDTFGSTSYLIYSDQSDGSAIVLHASRNDDSFGWMRWTLGSGNFESFAAIGSRLFASAERDGQHYLLEFDTESYEYITTDYSENSTATGSTAVEATHIASLIPNRTVQVTATVNGEFFYVQNSQIDSGGIFKTQPNALQVTVGDAMPFSFELHAPVIQSPTGPMAGKFQRIVSAEVNWDNAMSGKIAGQSVITPQDLRSNLSITAVDEWREYYIGDWGREPTLKIEGDTAGRMGVRGLIMNMYF